VKGKEVFMALGAAVGAVVVAVVVKRVGLVGGGCGGCGGLVVYSHVMILYRPNLARGILLRQSKLIFGKALIF
jgi:hypothetical protein